MAEIDATPNGPTANSYGSWEEAQAYFAARPNSAPWTGLATDQIRKDYLIGATQRLEQERYPGRKATAEQRLKWGRDGVVDEDGDVVDPTTIPQNLKWAEFEQAVYMASLGATDPSLPTGLEPFKVLKTTTVTMEMRDQTPVERSGLAPAAIRLLGDWLITHDVSGADVSPGTFRVRRV